MVLSFSQAYEIVQKSVRVFGQERVALAQALGRVLREDIVAQRDYPPFNKSAMDGFACRAGDVPGVFRVVETIAAGTRGTSVIGKGECARIMTGAPVPEGADCVVKIEDVHIDEPDRVAIERVGRDNICFQAEDARAGSRVLSRGLRLKPQHIAIAASCGYPVLAVARRPRVGIIATGDELIEPGGVLPQGSAKIFNSNAHQLFAQTVHAGAEAVYYGIASDAKDVLVALFKRAQNECDCLLISGGVSMGDFDFVPSCLSAAGFELEFEKVLVQPGKPTVFGASASCFCFGMPGNPVSTFVIFEVLVRDFLCACQSCAPLPQVVRVPVAASFARKHSGRTAFIPALLHQGRVSVLEYHGSGHITALAKANALVRLDEDVAQVRAGEEVDVRLI